MAIKIHEALYGKLLKSYKSAFRSLTVSSDRVVAPASFGMVEITGEMLEDIPDDTESESDDEDNDEETDGVETEGAETDDAETDDAETDDVEMDKATEGGVVFGIDLCGVNVKPDSNSMVTIRPSCVEITCNRAAVSVPVRTYDRHHFLGLTEETKQYTLPACFVDVYNTASLFVSDMYACGHATQGVAIDETSMQATNGRWFISAPCEFSPDMLQEFKELYVSFQEKSRKGLYARLQNYESNSYKYDDADGYDEEDDIDENAERDARIEDDEYPTQTEPEETEFDEIESGDTGFDDEEVDEETDDEDADDDESEEGEASDFWQDNVPNLKVPVGIPFAKDEKILISFAISESHDCMFAIFEQMNIRYYLYCRS